MKSLLSGSLITFGSRMVIFVFNLITLSLYTRALGPELRGVFAVLLLVEVILGLLVPPVDLANTYFASIKPSEINKIAGNTFAFVISSMLAIFIALRLVSLLPQYNSFLAQRGIEQELVWLAAIVVPPMLLWRALGRLLLGCKQVVSYNIILVFVIVLWFVTVLGLHILEAITLRNLLLANIASHTATAVFAVILVRRLTPFSRAVDFSLLKATLKYALRAQVWNASLMTERRFDTLMAAGFLTSTALGLYAAAVDLLEKFWALPESVATVLLPTIAARQGQDHGKATTLVVRHVFWITMFLALGVGIFAEPIVAALFGPVFLAASNLLRILLPSAATLTVIRLISVDYAGRGKPEFGALIAMTDIVVMLVLIVLLSPQWGARGVAIASIAGYVSAAFLAAWLFARKHHIGIATLFIPRMSDLRIYQDLFVSTRRRLKEVVSHS